jgi:acyl carrier protein
MPDNVLSQTGRYGLNAADLIEHRLTAILVNQLKLPADSALTPGALLSDVGLDSLGMLAFVASLDRDFGITISDSDYEALETFGDAVALVARLARG